MSTKIYEKQLPEHKDSGFEAYLFVSRHGIDNRFATEKNNGHKCAYQVRIANTTVFLTSDQMKEFVDSMNIFFDAEGYP